MYSLSDKALGIVFQKHLTQNVQLHNYPNVLKGKTAFNKTDN